MIQPFIKKIQTTLDYLLSKIKGIEKEVDTLSSAVENMSGGGGTVTSASNLGAGEGTFAALVGTDLTFKSIVAGENTNITSTATEITFNSTGFVQTGATNNATQLTLSSSKTVANGNVESFIIRVTAIQRGGSAGTLGDVWVHEFRGAVKQISGVTSLVDSVTDELIAEDVGASGYSVSVEAGTGTLDIKVTGELNKTINWRAVSIFHKEVI